MALTDIYEDSENTNTGSIGGNVYRVPYVQLMVNENGEQVPVRMRILEQDIIPSTEYTKKIPTLISDKFGTTIGYGMTNNRNLYRFEDDDWNFEYMENGKYTMSGMLTVTSNRTTQRNNRIIVTEIPLFYPLSRGEIDSVSVSMIHFENENALAYITPVIQSATTTIEFPQLNEDDKYESIRVLTSFFYVNQDFTQTAYNELFYAISRNFRYSIKIDGILST